LGFVFWDLFKIVSLFKRLRYYFQILQSKIFGGMTIFSKIIAGDIPSYKIAENERFFAFLDIFPLREGHVLVVPKTETDKFFDLTEEYLSQILLFAQPIAKAIERSFDCNRCGISVVGLEVPHAHLHLIPINSANDLNFNQPKLKMNEEQLREVQQKILGNLKI
jgi:histidine triad (HIT) family protein